MVNMICLAILVSFLSLGAFSEDTCPEKCFCNKKLTSVNCEGHEFHAIPNHLPKSIETLYMGHNDLYYVNFTANGVLPNLREIHLDSSKISGLKPNTFTGSLTPQLAVIYLRNNKISVVESRSFSNLSSLTTIYLTNNNIQEIQPNAFFSTPSVNYINLDSNYLSAIPQLGMIRKLQQLDLQANQITNSNFPSDYEKMTEIAAIGLSNNNIQSLDDATFENLKNAKIRKLELSRNKINKISKGAFKWLKHIISLKIGRNPLTSSVLETAFFGLVDSPLTSLNIDNVTLGGVLPSSTFQLLRNTSIKNLSMKNNKLGNIPKGGFADLKNLLSLDLSASGIFTIEDTAFEGLDSLNLLFLNDNQMTDVPNGLPPSLQKLYLNGNQITMLRNKIFSNLTKLQWLFLGNNKINKLEKDAFLGLTSLKKLHLVKNGISNLPGNIFASFVILESLELNKNNIKTIPNDPTLFSPMSSLYYLSLADNEFSSCPLDLFRGLKSLSYLQLQNNNLGDLIAGDVNGNLFAGLDRLITLNLTGNQLRQLPDSLFKDLVRVQNLTLRANQISTWGEKLFSTMSGLQNLDLKNNRIALVNSTSVKDLSKLSTLDLSENPFACTCDLRWFRDWMNTTDVRLLKNDTYTCNTPPDWHGKKVMDFDRTKINCLWFTEIDMILTGVGGFVVLLIFVIVIYKYRWFIKLRLYRIRRSCCCTTSKYEKGGYRRLDGEVHGYDAYISNAEDDYRWVIQNLFPGVDNGNYGDTEFGGEFRLFFEGRDAIVGAWAMENIVENMEASRVVILILTKEYIKKARCDFEIIYALELLEQDYISDVILVNVDGLRPKHVPKLLRRKMERNEFLTWEDSDEAKQTFKEQLIDILKKKRGNTKPLENIV